jgi:hypothetical protein
VKMISPWFDLSLVGERIPSPRFARHPVRRGPAHANIHRDD